MERIRQRSMSTFVLSYLINLGIGIGFGFVLGLVAVMFTRGIGAGYFLFVFPFVFGLGFFVIATNIYRIYFYYRLSLDINAVCEGDGQESESYILAAVLSTLTFGLYEIYWTYKLAQRLRANTPRYGFKMLETGKEIAVLSFFSFGFIAAWELIKNTNRVARV